MRLRWLALALLFGCAGEPPAPSAVPPPDASPSAPAPSSTAPPSAAAPSPPPPPAGVRLAPTSALPPGTRAAAVRILGTVVDREAGDPKNAWALAHGLLARGATFAATDGRLARDVLASDFLEEGPSFPRTRGAVRVEPHEDLILKSLVAAGVGLEEAIGAGGPTLGSLLAASQATFAPVRGEGTPSLFANGNDAPWSVQAWCQGARAGGRTSWTSLGGDVALDEVSASLLALLERETYPIRAAAAKRAPVQKNKRDIFAYTCGGAHLFQGVEACLATGWPRDKTALPRFQVLSGLYLYRVPFETAMVDQALQAYPQLAILLINQDVKFLGHLLESLGEAQSDGLWTPAPGERQLLDQAEARLVQDVAQLQKLGAYSPAAMAQLGAEEQTFQMYLDLVGDAAHALRGLEIQAEVRAGLGAGLEP